MHILIYLEMIGKKKKNVFFKLIGSQSFGEAADVLVQRPYPDSPSKTCT